ncbi:DUF7010 family protein [Sphingomicrobium astaxanthinifaciens]|uniref:DUF7010 family protein n=1 Tax=Sphingomicrobium astaxanthinifaciens TaxID=1227949 RepID=UPI001FCABA44|nr:hypothetical protein [Sphingomicrobium astaxanthinifaciens]MCJ7420977.1 hypothetical protein [Sphingomicrobium astaxanthinifaciens]
MIIAVAQADLRRAFVGGGPGLIVSGLCWLAAGLVAQAKGVPTGYAVLFVTGMFIFPSALLLCRFLFGRAPAAKDNPLGRVALESTFAMIAGIVIAHLFLGSRPDYVFPLVAIAVGTHFLAFRTAYGDARFWGLAGIVTAIGGYAIWGNGLSALTVALLVAASEILFGLWLLASPRGERAPSR